MTNLKDIQALLVTTIQAGPFDATGYFSNDLVVADTGESKDAIEAALNNRGFAVVVDLPIVSKTFTRFPGVAHSYVTIPVHVQVNVQVNSAGAAVSILEAVQHVFSAVLAYAEGDEADRFETEEEAFELIVTDSGLLAYVLWFRKMIALS